MNLYIYKGKYRARKKTEKIEYIVLHYPAMPNASADKVLRYFQTTKNSVSTHFVVDDNKVLECIPVDFVAYHVGGLCDHIVKYNNCIAYHEKAPTHYKAHNGNSIGIDLCDKKKNVCTCNVNDCDWFFSHETIVNAQILIVKLMKKYNISLDHVVRHYDVTLKACPRPFVGRDLSCTCDYNSMTCFDAWEAFKRQIQALYEL